MFKSHLIYKTHTLNSTVPTLLVPIKEVEFTLILVNLNLTSEHVLARCKFNDLGV